MVCARLHRRGNPDDAHCNTSMNTVGGAALGLRGLASPLQGCSTVSLVLQLTGNPLGF